MNFETIRGKALDRVPLTFDEALWLYETVPPARLFRLADALRRSAVEEPGTVTWQIDRNVNITNVCISGCKFCNFHCRPGERTAYITTPEAYDAKIEETLRLGGDQLLLQGGLHPRLDIAFYEELFRGLKARHPEIRLHALGAPEVAHIARISCLSIGETLRRLHEAGLDSLPGAGAEILCDEVRRRISPGKPSVAQWCEVMREAHRINLPTSATMMYGHVETPAQRIEHLLLLRGCRPNARRATTVSSPSSRGYSAARVPGSKRRGYVPASPRSNTCVSSPSAASYSTTYATYRLRGSPSARPRHR